MRGAVRLPAGFFARGLRVPPGTVKSRMARARKKLKLELEKEANER